MKNLYGIIVAFLALSACSQRTSESASEANSNTSDVDRRLAFPQGGDPGSLSAFPEPSDTGFLGATEASCFPRVRALLMMEANGFIELASGLNDNALVTRVWRYPREKAADDNILITVEGDEELCRITTLDEQSTPKPG